MELEVDVAAPPGAVWRMLRERAELPRWFGWDHADMDAEIEQIFLRDEPTDEDPEVVTVIEDGRVLELPGADRFVLEPAGDDATRVRLERGWEANGWDPISEGWITFLQQLRFALERHPGEDRRTLYLSGSHGRAPVAAVGLEALAIHGSSESDYSLDAITGEVLEGEVWFRTQFQVGLTVAGWGMGLLILTERPPDAGPPEGGGTAVLSTYGMKEADYDGLVWRWTDWWRGYYSNERIQPELPWPRERPKTAR